METLHLILGGVALLLCFLWVIRARHIPGIRRLKSRMPIIGDALTLIQQSNNIHFYLLEKVKENDGKSIGVAVPGQAYRLLTTVENVEYMLRTNFENFEKGHQFRAAFDELLGTGIFAADGRRWQTTRKAASHMFSLRQLRDSAMTSFTKYADDLVKQLDKSLGQAVDIQKSYFAYTFDAFSNIAFGQELGCLEKGHPLPAAFDAANYVCTFRTILPPMMWRTMRALGIAQEGSLKAAVKTLDTSVNEVIKTRLQDETGEGKAFGTDFLGLFIEAYVRRNEKPSQAELRDAVLNFIIAGRDTTAWTMTAMTLMLTQHPEVRAKCVAEVDRIVTDVSPTYDELEQLKYLEATLLETLRLYPSVPIQLKYAQAPDTFPDGSKVRKNDCMLYSSFVMGRLKSVWGADAEKFKPERWITADGGIMKVSESKYPVFNVGKRNCLGKPMAIMETKLVLAALLKRYTFELTPGHLMQFNLNATFCFTNGLEVKLAKRK